MVTTDSPDSLRETLKTSTRLVKLGETLFESCKPQINSKDELLYFFIIMGLYTSADKTFRGILLLCKDGNWEVARALLRTLLETLTNIRYISKHDSIQRAKEYFCFSAINDMKMMRAIEANSFFKDMGMDELSQKARGNLDRAKEVLPEDFPRLSRSKTWHGKKIETVMGDVGLQPAYDLVFRLTSQNIHATDAINHISLSQDRGLVLKFKPDALWVNGVASFSNSLFYSILRELDRIGKCECEHAILAMKEEILIDRAPSPKSPA
jgi:hypothetical protein